MKFKIIEYPGMGRGLVATQDIRQNTVIHIADLLELNKKDSKLVQKTKLTNYVYDLGYGKSAIALGFGSLFNHSENENVDFKLVKIKSKNSPTRTVIVYTTNRLIQEGDQLFINYGYDPNGQ